LQRTGEETIGRLEDTENKTKEGKETKNVIKELKKKLSSIKKAED